jgi:putative oxidoreductase
MALDRKLLDQWSPRGIGLVRIVFAFLFLQHPTAKFFGVPHVEAFDGLQVLSLIGAAGCIELVFGSLLLIGLWSRFAAFVLSGEMAFAYFIVHAPRGHVLSPILNNGEPAVLYCFIFLMLVFTGAGAWCVDRVERSGA